MGVLVKSQERAVQAMAEKPKGGMRKVILVWIIGLTLGVAAGAATAILLMPSQKAPGGIPK